MLSDSLESVYCSDNMLTMIDVSALEYLTTLQCQDNSLEALDVSSNLMLNSLECGNNPIPELDLSLNTALEGLFCYGTNVEDLILTSNTALETLVVLENDNLETLYLNNGNNHNLSLFLATSNPLLTCIQVDDVAYAEAHFTSIDAGASFSTSCVPVPFVSTWQISENQSITIPVFPEESYDYTVDWGDGQVESNFTEAASHTYSAAGAYDVKITGDFPRIYFNGSGDRDYIIDVSQWGNNVWSSMNRAFSGCKNLNISASDTPNLSQVTDMSDMFRNCEAFNSDINAWDVSTVTNISGLFYFCKVFNQPLDLWNVSAVTNMNGVFYLCRKFNQNINTWQVGEVTSMAGMFSDAKVFNQPLNAWDVSQVTTMESMFTANNAFNQPLDQWNTKEVTSMSYMFRDASAFNQPLNTWNVSGVTTMFWMFKNATVFNQPLNDWDVSQVTNMEAMFSGAEAFNQSLAQWDVSQVKNMYGLLSSTLSIENYDSTLLAWSLLPSLQPNITVDFGDSQYCAAEQAQQTMATNFNWTFMDEGKSDACDAIYVAIPDANFEQALVDLGHDTNGMTGNILRTEAEAITNLYISNPETNSNLPNVTSKISDLTGIESFVALTALQCEGNAITVLDLSYNTQLLAINCKNNALESLNVANTNNTEVSTFNTEGNSSLTCIQVDDQAYSLAHWFFVDEQTGFSENCALGDAESNYYTSVPDSDFEAVLIHYGIDDVLDHKFITKNAYYITALSTDVNGLKPVDLTGIEVFKALKTLQSIGGKLTTVDLSQNLNLESLTTRGALDTLDVSNLTKLKTLVCDHSELTHLNLKGAVNLESLVCSYNNLETLDVSDNTKLTYLTCLNNQLTALDVTNNTLLETLGCYDNAIEYIDLSPLTTLYEFAAQRNNLKYVNIRNGNNKSMSDFYVRDNPNLTCIQVDDETWSTTYWGSTKDNTASFSNDCSAIWEVYTTDSNLDTALEAVPGLDDNDDGIISYQEAQAFTGDLDLSGQNITSAQGLEAFSNAASINISGNSITDISNLLTQTEVEVESKTTGERRVFRTTATGTKKINASNNLITEIDLTGTSGISELNVSNNRLVYLNLNNNYNAQLILMDATGNPNLSCIQVDDVNIATANSNWSKDTMATYSSYCSRTTLGLADVLVDGISIYPNPATDKIQMAFPAALELKSVSLLNALGKQVLKSDQKVIDIKHLPTGLYFMSITTNKGVTNKKIVKK